MGGAGVGLGTMDVVETLGVVTTVDVDATIELVSVARAGEGVTDSDCPVAVVR